MLGAIVRPGLIGAFPEDAWVPAGGDIGVRFSSLDGGFEDIVSKVVLSPRNLPHFIACDLFSFTTQGSRKTARHSISSDDLVENSGWIFSRSIAGGLTTSRCRSWGLTTSYIEGAPGTEPKYSRS